MPCSLQPVAVGVAQQVIRFALVTPAPACPSRHEPRPTPFEFSGSRAWSRDQRRRSEAHRASVMKRPVQTTSANPAAFGDLLRHPTAGASTVESASGLAGKAGFGLAPAASGRVACSPHPAIRQHNHDLKPAVTQRCSRRRCRPSAACAQCCQPRSIRVRRRRAVESSDTVSG
jgi:hypothetical protein